MATIQDAVCLSLLTGASELFLPVRVNVSEQNCAHHYKSASMQTRCSYSSGPYSPSGPNCSRVDNSIQWAIAIMRIIVPICTFLQRMINLTRGIPGHFHQIHLNQEFFEVLIMWKAFLARWNGHSFLLDTTVTPSKDLELYTNAASSIGLGGYCNGQ